MSSVQELNKDSIEFSLSTQTRRVIKSSQAKLLQLPDDPTTTTLFMYVDDGKLTVFSKSLETNTKLLSSAYCRVN